MMSGLCFLKNHLGRATEDGIQDGRCRQESRPANGAIFRGRCCRDSRAVGQGRGNRLDPVWQLNLQGFYPSIITRKPFIFSTEKETHMGVYVSAVAQGPSSRFFSKVGHRSRAPQFVPWNYKLRYSCKQKASFIKKINNWQTSSGSQEWNYKCTLGYIKRFREVCSFSFVLPPEKSNCLGKKWHGVGNNS